MKEEIHRSCIDCRVTNCDRMERQYPAFCPTEHGDKTVLDAALRLYEEPENACAARASAEVEAEFYGKYTRLEETAAFAAKLGVEKIGIATCVGLIRESQMVAKFFRHKGFEVVGLACKAGVTPKSVIGVEPCGSLGPNMCNPIYQAEFLNAEETGLNVVIGLCVGHDALFTKYSKALCTTLIAKDRVLGHNPVAAVYLSDSYYSHLMD